VAVLVIVVFVLLVGVVRRVANDDADFTLILLLDAAGILHAHATKFPLIRHA